MLFFNFLCLLYLMVLSNSHTISKSIDADDGIDEVSDTIVNLYNPRHHRIRRDRIHQKYRIREEPKRQSYVITGADIDSRTAKLADRPYIEIITFNATTANPIYRSHKRKIGGFWRRFKAKTTGADTVIVKKRQVSKIDKYEEVKNADDRESYYFNPTNRKKNINSFIFQQPAKVTADDELEVTVDVPLKKKHTNVKFVFTPYVMYASKLTPSMLELIDKSVNKKTTESMNSAIAEMNTQIDQLKKIYGDKKSQIPTESTSSFPRTAEIEELLTGIKMKAIQMVVESGPSMVDIISNTVTEATYGADHLWNRMGTPFSRYLLSTFHVDNAFKTFKDEYPGSHHLVTRSASTEPLSIANIEDMLQKEIKSIYHKMRLKVGKESLRCKSQSSSVNSNTSASITTPTAITNTSSTVLPPATTIKPTAKSKSNTQKSKSPNQTETSQYPIKTTTKAPQRHDKLGGKDESLPRIERDNIPTDEKTTKDVELASADDYNMLHLYEQVLQKVQEDNAMKLMATANLPSNIHKNERYRLSKRNPETLTDIELKESVQTLYNDGVIIPDYEIFKTLSTPSVSEIDDKGYEIRPTTSYEDLSKKIAYDDFVNGYKHYLKFQQEKAKEDNFSAMVKYQAHRHHNVNDIGKYILDKIPQLPQESTASHMQRLKRFFEDLDMEDQEVSTKTDDSWFRKHFYIFLDYGPPKKFHTSQIVSLKPPMADINSYLEQSTKMIAYNQSSNSDNLYYSFGADGTVTGVTKKTTTPSTPINLDDLTKSLDAVKSSTMKNSMNEVEKLSKSLESTTEDMMSYTTLPVKLTEKQNSIERRNSNKYIRSTANPFNATSTLTADRHKRANESVAIAEDFATKDLEERSSTPVKEMQADVTIQSKHKNGNNFGYVDINLVPTHSINLHVNCTKADKKSKLRDFFKKFNFKSMKSKKKNKRACSYRPPRFNPFKSLKNKLFKPTDKTPKSKSSSQKQAKSSTNSKTTFNPLSDPLLDKPIQTQKTTKVNKFISDTNDVQVPGYGDNGNYGFSDTLKPLSPNETPPPKSRKQPVLDTSHAEKIPSFESLSSEPVKAPSAETVSSQLGKNTRKPSTFLMMLDDGAKSVLYVQPETVRKSTRNMKPPKKKTTAFRTLSRNMKPKTTKNFGEVLSVNVKTLRTLPSIVMKALTSIATNETMPDLNLEIAKLQYGLSTYGGHSNEKDLGRSTKSTHMALVKPLLDDLTYTNQLTRYAKLSLPKSKRMEGEDSVETSDEIPNTLDYHMSDEYAQEPMEKQGYEERSSGSPMGTDKNFKNIDYFNDLLMWNNDILNIDKVPQPEWRDLVKSVQKDLGSTEYPTPNIYTMMNELKELDKQNLAVVQSPYTKNLKGHNLNEALIRRVVLNDKALVNSKDLLIKGEQKYFQYNRPNIMDSFRGMPSAATQTPRWPNTPDNIPFKPVVNTWAADITVQSPITWVKENQKDQPSTTCKPTIIIAPEKHITWSNKCEKETWTVRSPITWTCDPSPAPCDNTPAPDCLSKIARKFYIGAKPCQNPLAHRLLRLSTLTDSDLSKNKAKLAKVAKSATSDVETKVGKPGKTETAAKADKYDASAKEDKLTDSRKEYSTKDTPALMVDTTLLSYDDEVETVTNGIDVKKMSRNSQKTEKLSKAKSKAMTSKALVNVVAKTSKRPQMYYSTPLPMKPSDFNKFLKEQGMDVESLISPIYGQTTLFQTWSKPSTMSFMKHTHTPIVLSNSSAVTKLTSFFSRYSTRLDKLKHKPKHKEKFEGNKENLGTVEKSKGKMKKKLRVNANPLPGSVRYKRYSEPVINYVLERPNLTYRRTVSDRSQQNLNLNPYKRIKKLKLFRQKYSDIESPPKPKIEPGSEEKFSPELQAKLSHLQETKHITVPKTKPKTGDHIDPKFLPTFEPQFVPTSDKKLDTEKEYTLTTKTAATEKTTLVSKLEPVQDDSEADTPIQLSGSIIFTSEDPRNEDVDITIINFDDMKNENKIDFSSQPLRLSQKHDTLKFLNGQQKILKSNVDKAESLSSRTEKLNENYDTLDSSYRLTTKQKEDLNRIESGRLLLNKKLKEEEMDSSQRTSQTTYADTQLASTGPADVDSAKHQNAFSYFDKLRKTHEMLNPNRIQITSHHYKYDILYKIPDKPQLPTKFQHKKQKVKSLKVDPLPMRKSSSVRMRNQYNKAITLKEDSEQKKLNQRDKYLNRRWVTIESRFRYGRDADVTEYPYKEGDKGYGFNKRIDNDYVDVKNLEKRFFGFSPKIQFIQDKLSLKRMTATPKITASKTRGYKARAKGTTAKDTQTSELLPSLDELYKPKKENETKILEGNKLTDGLEGFRIKFGRKKIADAVEKIQAMTTDDLFDSHTNEIKYGIPGKFEYVRKNSTKSYDDFDILSEPSSVKDIFEKDAGDREIAFKFSTAAHPPSKYNPAEFDYSEMIRDPEHASQAANEKAASHRFEQTIFDKSMYGKKNFDESAFEKAIFGPEKLKTKSSKNYSHLLTDIMSYDVTPDNLNDKYKNVDYDESSLLPDQVTVDNPATEPIAVNSNSSNSSQKKNYIFDSASILYNKSYLNHFGLPATKMLLYTPSDKTYKTTEKPLPVPGNTLSVLFRNPLEGHLGFGVKPIIQANRPKPGEGLTLQATPMPTPLELMQARFSQNPMGRPWNQMPFDQANWPQMQANSMGMNPFQNGFRYNSSETYGIYVEPGILNYDYNQPVAPLGRDQFYADLNYGRSEKKNAKQYLKAKDYIEPNILGKSFVTFKQLHSSKTTRKTPFSIYIKTYAKNKKNNSLAKSPFMKIIQTVSTTRHPPSKRHCVKRDIPAQDTYTAKDVAALEVIVDLMRNTLGYEEKDIGSIFTTNIIHPMQSIHQPHDSTNSIQVHIAIPYDMQNTKKRSPSEPVRVRKVFSAKMSSPVDLEYQVHSFEGGSIEAPTSTTASSDDGLSPGMYLLIDKPKNGYALKPVKTNIDFAELKSRQAGNLPIMELKGETTLQHDSIKNLAKVTLSKNFISAVNKQLVDMYENLTKPNASHSRRRRHTTQTTKMMSQKVIRTTEDINKNYRFQRVIDWDAVKKYFGYSRVCNCKCKANKPMCRACAASDAVIEELTFEFDNLGKFMKDHCTEIQTYFWVNPSGGLKLRNAVNRIDESLRDYYKRSKGKCQGRTCEALGKQIEKRQFVKSTKVPLQNPVENLVDDLVSIADDINKITAMKTCYNDKLQAEGQKIIDCINSCISYKAFGKRSDAETSKKKFVKNVYSLDNINVNIICNPDISSTTEPSSETPPMPSTATVSTQKLQEPTLIPDNFFDFEVENFKNHSKRRGFKRLFLKRNNKKKLFTYYTVQDVKTPKTAFKREANNQIEMPLVADSGGTFWLDYLRAATTNEPQNTKDPMTQNEPKVDIAVVQTKEFVLNDNENSVSSKTMNVKQAFDKTSPIMSMNVEKDVEATTNNLTENLNELLNLFENFIETKNYTKKFSVFSQKLESQQTVKIKSMRPTTPKKIFAVTSRETSKTAVTSLDKLKKLSDTHSTRPSHSTSRHKTTSHTKSTKSWDKFSNIRPEDKTTLNITNLPNASTSKPKMSQNIAHPSNKSSDTVLQSNVTSYTIPEGSLPSEPISGDTIFADTISSDFNISNFNISETKSAEFLDTEKLSTSTALPQTLSSDDIFSDNSTETSVSSSNKTAADDIYSDIMPPGTIFHDNVSQDDKPNISEYKLVENTSSSSAFSDIIIDSQKNEMDKATMSLLYSLRDIEKQLDDVQSNFVKAKSTPSVNTKNKSKQFAKLDKKRSKAPAPFLNKLFLFKPSSMHTTSNTETTQLKSEPNEINQKLAKAPNVPTDKTLTAAANVTTEKAVQETDSAKQEYSEKVTSPTPFVDLTSNFYLLKKTSPVLGHSDYHTKQLTTPSMDSVEDVSSATNSPPKIIIINEYDQVADTYLNQNERNSEKYKNLLLSIIQYETKSLNDEWQRIARTNDKNDGSKRSATLSGDTSWHSTFRSNLLEENVSGTPELPKKKGLLNKLVSKIGMKVVSAKKKVAHSSSPKCSISKSLTETMVDLRQTDKPTSQAASSVKVDKVIRITSNNNTLRYSKQKKAIMNQEASHLYPSSHTVCDIQATFNHVTQRRQELAVGTFEAYVKDVPCYKYRRLQRSFLITRKTRIPKWDWIRNKRSVLHFHKNKNREKSHVQFCDKFEMFVRDDDGIYRIMERKKRDTSRSINQQLRHLPLLKPGKNELYVMVGDSVTLDCPLQPQRSTYSQYIWGSDPKELLNCDNVRVDGFTLVIKKVGPRNVGRYSCSVDGVIRKSTKVTVVALPAIDVVFPLTYKTPRDCNYDDLNAIQQLGREMSDAVRCGNICSIRIDEPMCQKDRATNRSLIRSTGVLSMSSRRFQCSVQCRRDLFSSLLRLAVGNVPAVMNTRVTVYKDGVNETLKPWKYAGRPMTTHTLRKKDSTGHFEYHKFSTLAEPGQMHIVTLCNPGFYLLKEQNFCAPCPVNTSSSLGDNVCSACAAGTTSPPGAAECYSIIKRLRRYDWWLYPPCGYVLAFGSLVCACGVCMVLALVVHLGSRGVEPRCPCHGISSACLEMTATTKPHIVTGYMQSSRARPLSPSRVILARFFKPSLPSSRGTVVDSQETRFEMWKENNIPPSLPDIDFDIDTS